MKLTSWNVAWLDHAWGVVEGRYAPGRSRASQVLPTLAKAQQQVAAVAAEVARLDPDVLFLCEAPRDEADMARFVTANLAGYRLVTRPAGQGYETSGDQWQWFMLRDALAATTTPELLDIAVWHNFVARQVRGYSSTGKWPVAYPVLTDIGEVRDVPVSTRKSHEFYRHPQVLRLRIQGSWVEIIGVHLKSKFTKDAPRPIQPGQTFETYLTQPRVAAYIAGSHVARVKLSSEASIVRAYIDQRFAQEGEPAIFVVGDMNDGPGKELMEEQYLLHDLISNLQGDVFFARQFLNHALFDQPQNLRWTVSFRDKLEPGRDPNILLDHILFTQSLTRSGEAPVMVGAQAGKVEHRIHEEIEALFGAGVASDHRPVSVTLTSRAVA